MSNGPSGVGQFAGVLVFNALTSIINFGSMIAFARLLGTDALGRYAEIALVVNLSMSLFSAGFNQALIQRPEDQNLQETILALTVAQAILATVTMAAAFAALGTLKQFNG